MTLPQDAPSQTLTKRCPDPHKKTLSRKEPGPAKQSSREWITRCSGAQFEVDMHDHNALLKMFD